MHWTDREALDALRAQCSDILTTHQIVAPPVPIHRIAEERGMEIMLGWWFPRGLAGCLMDDDYGRFIIVDARRPPASQRFTVGHELYHALTGKGEQTLCLTYYDNPYAEPDELWEERKADRFSAELLMPADWVRYFMGQGFTMEHLCAQFGVSHTAMRRRLTELGYGAW